MNKIIVHGGTAHLDDFVASAIALTQATAQELETVKIERREPTTMDLADPEVWVLDVGNQHEPMLHNFDHHQLKGGKCSAMTLVAAGIKDFGGCADAYAFLRRAWPWFDRRAELDSCGPLAAAKAAGTEWSVVKQFLGPFEEMVLRQFEFVGPRERVQLVLPITQDAVRKAALFDEVSRQVKDEVAWWGPLMVVDFTAADPQKADVVSEMILADHKDGVAIFHDNRGDGLTLLRIKDDPRVDFNRVKDDPEVRFVHLNGFVCKTNSKDLNAAWKLIEGAFRDVEPVKTDGEFALEA